MIRKIVLVVCVGATLGHTQPTSAAMDMDLAKKKCEELGFKPQTEGFGRCVLQLSKVDESNPTVVVPAPKVITPETSTPIAPTPPVLNQQIQHATALIVPVVTSDSYRVAPDSNFPSRSIRIVVPSAPGGTSDYVARLLVRDMAQRFGQSIVIDNKAGAGGLIGSDAIAKASPDGYNLLIGTTATQAIYTGIYKRIPFDPKRDFTPIAIFAESSLVLIVPTSGPTSVQDLINRARNGTMRFASGGQGSIEHLTGEYFKAKSATNLVHVPSKGGVNAFNDLLSGQVQLLFFHPAMAVPHIKLGRINALAVTGQQRSPLLNGVPTLAEAGVSGVEATSWFGMFAPVNTPSGVVSRLYQAILQAVSTQDVARELLSTGLILRVRPPNDAKVFVQSEVDKWHQIVRAAGVSID